MELSLVLALVSAMVTRATVLPPFQATTKVTEYCVVLATIIDKDIERDTL